MQVLIESMVFMTNVSRKIEKSIERLTKKVMRDSDIDLAYFCIRQASDVTTSSCGKLLLIALIVCPLPQSLTRRYSAVTEVNWFMSPHLICYNLIAFSCLFIDHINAHFNSRSLARPAIHGTNSPNHAADGRTRYWFTVRLTVV